MKPEIIAVFSFGVVFVVTLMVIAVAFPEPKPFQYTVFRIVLALAAAGVAALIPGLIQVTLNDWVKAGGALAVFVIVYFFSPAQLVGHPVPNPGSSIVFNDLNELSKLGHGQVSYTDAIQEIEQLATWVQAVQQRETSLRSADLGQEYDSFVQALTEWSELKSSLQQRHGPEADQLKEEDFERIGELIKRLYGTLFELTAAIDERLQNPS